MNIMSGHAYSILKLQDLQGTKVVQIRNPWGSGKEWDGSYSDHWQGWSDGTVTEEEKVSMGYTVEEDGTWWMSFDDMLLQFDELSVCRIMSGFVSHHVTGEWRGINAGGSRNMQLNPQFHLMIQEDSHVVVELRLPSRRPKGISQYPAICPIVVANADRHQNVFLQPRLGDPIFHHSRSSVLELDLRAADGPFAIVPATFEADHECLFHLDIYTDKPSSVIALKDDDLPKDAVTGEVLQVPLRN